MKSALLDLVFRMAKDAPYGVRWRIDQPTIDALLAEIGQQTPQGGARYLIGIPVEIADVPCLRLVVTA